MANSQWMAVDKITQKMDLEEVAETQTQAATFDEKYDTPQDSQPVIEKSWWGRLHKKSILKRSLGTKATLTVANTAQKTDTIDIRGPQFTFGRHHHICDYVITKNDGLDEKSWSRISKVHFVITKDMSYKDAPIVIEDKSRNGTMLNGELIGKNQKQLLLTGDIISVIDSRLHIFSFEDLTIRDRIDLPDDLKKQFFVDRKLGSGAFGEVFKVLDRRLFPMAIKHIKSGSCILTGGQTVQETTNNEIKILKKLSHPCIIKTIDVIEYRQGGATIILEYMAGGDLLNRIMNHPLHRLTEDQSCGIFYQVASALQYLHKHGITHRDIKPDNVLLADLSDSPLVKLSDFGLSKVVTDGTALKSLLGTPNYVAPEILKCCNKLKYTNRVDVWSMGVMLFAMLSGTLPFAEEYGDISAQILRGKFEFLASSWKNISVDAKTFIKQMLVVDPKKRMSVNEMFNTVWLISTPASFKPIIDKLKPQTMAPALSDKAQHRSRNKENGFLVPEPPTKRMRLQEPKTVTAKLPQQF